MFADDVRVWGNRDEEIQEQLYYNCGYHVAPMSRTMRTDNCIPEMNLFNSSYTTLKSKLNCNINF